MGQWRVLGPETRRVATRDGVILYDASRARNLGPAWFESAYWRKRGAVEGAARGRGSTLFVSAGRLRLALRQYRRGGLVSRWLQDRYLWLGEARTRPIDEWCMTYALHRQGLPVPAPIGARVRRSGRWYTGALLTERVPGARTLANRLAAHELSLTDWIAIGRCIRRFHDAGACHADLNAHNVLFDADGAVWLIDFDRGAFRRPGLWQDANLVRLRRSLLKITDPLPAGRFGETDWQSLLAGYAEGAGASGPAASPASRAAPRG